MATFKRVSDTLKSEVAKVQLEVQRATSATSAIAEVALRTKVFKICCAFNFLWLIAQFYTLNSILFCFDRNIDDCRPSLANYLLFFCLKSLNCGICIV